MLRRATRRLAARALRGMLGNALAESSPLVQRPAAAARRRRVPARPAALLLVPAFELAGLHPQGRPPPVGGHRLVVRAPGFAWIVIALLAYASIRATGLVVTALRARRRQRQHPRRIRAREARPHARRGDQQGHDGGRPRHRDADDPAAVQHRHHAGADRRRHRRPGGRLRRADARPRRDQRVLPPARGPGSRRRRRRDQRHGRDWSNSSTFARSSCATAREPCTSFRTAGSPRSPTGPRTSRTT